MLVEFRLLGPVEIWTGDRLVNAGEPRRRAVLAALLFDAGTVVPSTTLIDRVWGEEPPARAVKTLGTHVTRIRRVLEEAAGDAEPLVLASQTGGYRLAVDREQVDLHRFRRLVRDARDPATAGERRVTMLREAMTLWRGEPLTGIPGDWASRTRDHLVQERLGATVAWADAELEVDNAAAVLAPLAELAGEHPMMEPLTAALMRALVAAGRPGEALERCRAHRQRLIDEQGIEQGPQLRALYDAILRGDEQPAPQRDAARGTGPAAVPADATRPSPGAPAATAGGATTTSGATTAGGAASTGAADTNGAAATTTTASGPSTIASTGAASPSATNDGAASGTDAPAGAGTPAVGATTGGAANVDGANVDGAAEPGEATTGPLADGLATTGGPGGAGGMAAPGAVPRARSPLAAGQHEVVSFAGAQRRGLLASRRRFALAAGMLAAALALGSGAAYLGTDRQDAKRSPTPAATGEPALAEDFSDGLPPEWKPYGLKRSNGSAWSPSAVRVLGGELQIVGTGRQPSGKGNVAGGLCWCEPGGKMRTYGRWQVHAKFDQGAGYGPMIGLYPEKDETDPSLLTAARLDQPARNSVYPEVQDATGEGIDVSARSGDFTNWATYEIEWRPKFVKISVDDLVLFDSRRSREPMVIPYRPMFLYVQMVPGPDGPVPAPDKDTPSQVVTHVDWARYYA